MTEEKTSGTVALNWMEQNSAPAIQIITRYNFAAIAVFMGEGLYHVTG